MQVGPQLPPLLLSRRVPLQGVFVQSGDDVLAEGVVELPQTAVEVRVVTQRVPEVVDRQVQLEAGQRGAGPAEY